MMERYDRFDGWFDGCFAFALIGSVVVVATLFVRWALGG